MKKSREVKRELLVDLWERFLDEQREMINSVQKLNWKLEKAKKKIDKVLIQKMIDSAPTSLLTHDKLFNVTEENREYYLDKYFKMRLIDYAIQTQTRYCSAAAADLDTIEELTERNIDFEQKIYKLCQQIGIPLSEVNAYHHHDIQANFTQVQHNLTTINEGTSKQVKQIQKRGAFKRKLTISKIETNQNTDLNVKSMND